MDGDLLKQYLNGLPVPEIRAFDQIGSTNDEAIRWAAQGAQDGCLVVADMQTQGRGRFNRRWVTRPGVALAFSLILRPTPAEMPYLGLFSPLGALAIGQALEKQYNLAPLIKWPNDVLLERKKVAGILVESVWMGEEASSIVVGIGINISPAAVPPAEELLFPAISVEDVTGQPVDRFAFLSEILRQAFQWRKQLHQLAFIEEWNRLLAFRGEWVQIKENGGASLTGQVMGVDREGNLLLHGKDGQQHTVVVGDLHLRLVE